MKEQSKPKYKRAIALLGKMMTKQTAKQKADKDESPMHCIAYIMIFQEVFAAVSVASLLIS